MTKKDQAVKQHVGKITARPPAALRGEIRGWHGAISDRFAFRGRKLALEDFACLVLLDFMRRDPDEREAILRDRMPELAEMYAADEQEHELEQGREPEVSKAAPAAPDRRPKARRSEGA